MNGNVYFYSLILKSYIEYIFYRVRTHHQKLARLRQKLARFQKFARRESSKEFGSCKRLYSLRRKKSFDIESSLSFDSESDEGLIHIELSAFSGIVSNG
jgi:hypothetical protein